MKSAIAIAVVTAACALAANAEEPIRIGFGLSETGGSAGVAKQYLVTAQIWADDVNAKGGLLGRKVEIIHYDDQSNPALEPGIYTKLLDVDKVDLLLASGTNYSSAAMPIIMQHNALVLDTLSLAVNDEFHYPRFFQTMPWAQRQGGDLGRVLRRRDGDGPQAQDRSDRRRRRRILEECDRRRQAPHREGRAEDRL